MSSYILMNTSHDSSKFCSGIREDADAIEIESHFCKTVGMLTHLQCVFLRLSFTHFHDSSLSVS